MPDISMCSGLECPLKETCYRYKATPSDWQSYLSEVPYDASKNNCEYHMAIWKKQCVTNCNELSSPKKSDNCPK